MDNELFMFIQTKIEEIRQGKYKGYHISLTEDALTIITPEKKYTIHPATLECTTDKDATSWVTSNYAIYALFVQPANSITADKQVSTTQHTSHPPNKSTDKPLRLSRRFK